MCQFVRSQSYCSQIQIKVRNCDTTIFLFYFKYANMQILLFPLLQSNKKGFLSINTNSPIKINNTLCSFIRLKQQSDVPAAILLIISNYDSIIGDVWQKAIHRKCVCRHKAVGKEISNITSTKLLEIHPFASKEFSTILDQFSLPWMEVKR